VRKNQKMIILSFSLDLKEQVAVLSAVVASLVDKLRDLPREVDAMASKRASSDSQKLTSLFHDLETKFDNSLQSLKGELKHVRMKAQAKVEPEVSPRERLKGKVKTVAALAAKGLEGHRTSLEKDSLLDTCEAVRALPKKAFAVLVQDVGKYFATVYKSLNLKGVAIGSEDFDARWLISKLAGKLRLPPRLREDGGEEVLYVPPLP
jgi:hypothetical protein